MLNPQDYKLSHYKLSPFSHPRKRYDVFICFLSPSLSVSILVICDIFRLKIVKTGKYEKGYLNTGIITGNLDKMKITNPLFIRVCDLFGCA
jgi:hypothetical protein